MDRIRELEDALEELQEKMRDKDQLIANQAAEITALRRKMVNVSEVLDDLISSELNTKDLLVDCREVLVKMQREVDKR